MALRLTPVCRHVLHVSIREEFVQERLLEMSGFDMVYSGCVEIGHQT